MDTDVSHVPKGPSSFGNMLSALEEMETTLYAVDLPLKVFTARYRYHSGKGLPKTRRRWLNFLASEFRFCVVKLPKYLIIKMAQSLQTRDNCLYAWITSHTREFSDNVCTVLLKPEPESLYNELIRRKILRVRGHRARYNIT